MAQKRPQEEEPFASLDLDAGEDSPEEKRLRRVSAAAIAAEVLKGQTLQKFCSVLEPLLRKVVNEEVERALEKHIPAKSEPSMQQIGGSASRNLQLQFRNRLSLPIYTGSRIEGEQCCPIQVVLIDASTGQIVTAGPESSMKVEIVVLEGDFEGDEDEDWTEEDFDNHVVREREGKRPLLNGELVINLKEGVGILGELSFTDNSSWIRCRKFKLGARITVGFSNGIRIREAKTDSFSVKDHRGELYKKHYPPALHDEVWRLDKIGKDGAFHRRLNKEKIYSVQDFLRLVSIDPQRLRNVLGTGMSNKMWEGTVEHAKSSVLDNKLFVYYADKEHTTGIVFNVICEILGFLADGQYILVHQLSEAQKLFVNKMIKYVYENWNEVVEYDASSLVDNRSHGLPTLPGHVELADGQGGQIAFHRHAHQQHCESLEVSNNVWMSGPAENLNIATPSQFAIEGFVQQNMVPQMSSSLALRTQQAVINPLQQACDNQNLDSYPDRNSFQNESIGGMHLRNDYAHQGINDQCVDVSISRNNWNGDLYEGSEGFYLSRSGDKLASEWEPQSLDGADLQAQVQSLIQIITAGTSGQPDNTLYNTRRDEAFAFSVFTPTSDVSFNMSTRRLHGKAYIFWLKLKAALKWGISIRKVAAAKRARLVEIED